MSLRDNISSLIAQELEPHITPLVAEYVDQGVAEILADADGLTSAVESLVNAGVQQVKSEIFNEVPPPQYPTVVKFIVAEILPMYGLTESRSPAWSAKWYNHPEAIKRFTALWQQYEKLRVVQPDVYQEVFYHMHADYHMDRIMRDGGVFADCRHHDTPLVPLATLNPPKKS